MPALLTQRSEKKMADVLLLRREGDARDLVFALEEDGVSVEFWPLLDVQQPDDPRALCAAIEQLSRYEWVIPDGPAAVRVLSELAHAAGTFHRLNAVAFLAPEHDTARTLGQFQWMARALLPTDDSLHEAIAAMLSLDDHALVLTHAKRRALWDDAFDRAGRKPPTIVDAFVPSEAASPRQSLPRVIVVHSPAAAEALAREAPAQLLSASRVIAAGPSTAHALTHLGMSVWATAKTPAADSVAEATFRAVSE